MHRFYALLLDEFSKLHAGALTRNDVTAAIGNALRRYDYGESA